MAKSLRGWHRHGPDATAAAVAPGGTDGNQLADCSSPFSQFVTFAGGVCNQGTTIGNDISRIRTLTVNGPEVTTRGLDLSVNYSRDMGSFGLSAGANATYILEYEFSDFVYEGLTFSQGYDAKGFANYNRAPGTVSPWRANGYLSASFGNASAAKVYRVSRHLFPQLLGIQIIIS